MNFYTWYGKNEKIDYDSGIEIFALELFKDGFCITLFDYYFGIGIIIGPKKRKKIK